MVPSQPVGVVRVSAVSLWASDDDDNNNNKNKAKGKKNSPCQIWPKRPTCLNHPQATRQVFPSASLFLFVLFNSRWLNTSHKKWARAYFTWVCAIQWKNKTKTHDRRGRVHSTSQKRLFFLLVFVFFFFSRQRRQVHTVVACLAHCRLIFILNTSTLEPRDKTKQG